MAVIRQRADFVALAASEGRQRRGEGMIGDRNIGSLPTGAVFANYYQATLSSRLIESPQNQ